MHKCVHILLTDNKQMKSQRSFFISPAIRDVFICVSALQNFIQYLSVILSIHCYDFYISIQNFRDLHDKESLNYRSWNSKYEAGCYKWVYIDENWDINQIIWIKLPNFHIRRLKCRNLCAFSRVNFKICETVLV